MIIAGVRRGSIFSPNHIGNDAAIFNETTKELRALGCIVNEYTEEEFIGNVISEKFIFNMARDFTTINKLKELEDKGHVVINSGYGITNCMREKMTNLIVGNHIPHPQSVIVDTDKDATELLLTLNAGKYWIKRADCHAIHREDVSYARSLEVACNIINEFHLRGIERAVVNKHLTGDLLKFYGVHDSDFFYWFYPGDRNHSKFGNEQQNGDAQHFSFSIKYLKEICKKTAETLNIKIYGGDCIVDTEGNIQIIDFNDWPSFAPCRTLASPHIATCIYNECLKKASVETKTLF